MPHALDLLRQEHSNMATLMQILERQVDEFQRGDRPDYDVIRAVLDYLVSFPDVCHHPKEDVIFAKLHERDPLTTERIGDLQNAHEKLAARTRDFSAGLRAVLEEAEIPREAFIRLARRFIDQQRQHIDMEESTFFPAAEKALTSTDWVELNTLMARPDDAGERFEQLRKTILQWQAEDEVAADQDRDPNRHPMRKSS
jgi:hemerythrin-like domain-containing protein